MTSLLDQSALADLAERLVAAAKRAGADAGRRRRRARRVAVGRGARRRGRGIAALRRRRSRACACWSASKQAVVSTNDVNGDGLDCAGRARGRHGARGARGSIRRPRRSGAAGAQASPISICSIPTCPTSACWNGARARPRRPRLAVAGVSKSGGASASAGIGGMVLVTSHGFHGATIGSRHSISMSAIAGNGTGMENDYDYTSTLHAADLESAAEDRPQRRRARGQAAQSAQGRDAPRAGGVRSAHCRLAGRPSRQRRQRRLDRAQDEFPARKARRADFRAGIDIIDDPLRKRGLRSRPFDAEGVATRRAKWSRTAC